MLSLWNGSLKQCRALCVCCVMWYGGEQVAEISASIVDVRAAYALLSEFKVQLSRDRLELEWEAYRGPQRIAIKMAEVGYTPSWSRACVPFCLFEPLSVGGRGCPWVCPLVTMCSVLAPLHAPLCAVLAHAFGCPPACVFGPLVTRLATLCFVLPAPHTPRHTHHADGCYAREGEGSVHE